MIQGIWKEHRHVSHMEHGRNLGGGVERIIRKTIRTIRTIGMMEQGQETCTGFGLSCSENFRSTRKYGKHPEGMGSTGKHWKLQEVWERAGNMELCLEMH